VHVVVAGGLLGSRAGVGDGTGVFIAAGVFVRSGVARSIDRSVDDRFGRCGVVTAAG